MTYRQLFPTRWNDNDVYGHLNNTIYYASMDTTINTWMIDEGGLDIVEGEVLGVCAASCCRYGQSASFPDALAVDLAVASLGTTSITWQLTISRARDAVELATGEFVHVFIDRQTRRPIPIPARPRGAVETQLEVIA